MYIFLTIMGFASLIVVCFTVALVAFAKEDRLKARDKLIVRTIVENTEDEEDRNAELGSMMHNDRAGHIRHERSRKNSK